MATSDSAFPWREDPAVPPLFGRLVASPGADARTAQIYVVLHGAGATEDDLLGLSGPIDPQGIFLAYRAPIPYGGGFCWFPLGWDGQSIQIDDSVAPHSRDRIARQLRHDLANLGRSESAVTVIGFSQGAAMALACAASDPGLFDRLVLLSGLRVPSVLNTIPESVSLPPTLVQHGLHDDIVPIAEGHEVAAWCKTRNSEQTTFQTFAMGHTISEDSLTHLVAWLNSTCSLLR